MWWIVGFICFFSLVCVLSAVRMSGIISQTEEAAEEEIEESLTGKSQKGVSEWKR